MRRLALVAGACFVLCAAASCESSLSLDELLEGRPCRKAKDPRDRCLDGYECNADEVCVKIGSAQAGEGGSAGGGGSSTSDDGGPGGSSGGTLGSGTSGTGGSAGEQGEQGGAAGDVGSGGSAAQGGSSDGPDASVPLPDGCVPGPLYRDRDGDGYGSEAPGDVEFGCELQGYVSVGGDCHDEVRGTSDRPDLVHPGQTQFHYELNLDPTKPQGISYDFNCDLQEEPDPDLPGPPVCPTLLGGLDCAGTGYAETGRSGSGVNPLCGSETIITCEPQAVTQCVANFGSASIPFGCR